MPSSIAHALTAAVVTVMGYPARRPPRLMALAAAGAVLLDADALGRPFGLGDVRWLGGHRALTHALPVAALVAALLVAAVPRRLVGATWLGVWACLAVAFATHGGLDALSRYGDGVMFFAPFASIRLKAPWQPFRGLWPEVVGVWVPALAVLALDRRRARAAAGVGAP